LITPTRRHLLAALTGALALPVLGSVPVRVAAQERPYWPTFGWRQMVPGEVGVDPAIFDEVTARIQSEAPTRSAMVVAFGGNPLYEDYADGFLAHRTTDIWSSTESITGTAVGIAIDDGILSLESRPGDLIPDQIPDEAEPVVQDIAVRNILTMRDGWLWDGTVDYANTDNWAQRTLTLTLPMETAPGDLFTCNSGGTHVLSGVLQALIGRTLRAFAQERIFGPMGVEIADWRESPQGESAGGWGPTITPREMAKYGYPMLNGGQWDGEQLVPANWVAQATRFQSDSTGTNDSGLGADSGYHWWLADIAGFPAFFSLGYGESCIYVVPGLNLVAVAATADVPPFDVVDDQSRP